MTRRKEAHFGQTPGSPQCLDMVLPCLHLKKSRVAGNLVRVKTGSMVEPRRPYKHMRTLRVLYMSKYIDSTCSRGNDQYRDHTCGHATVTTGKGMTHRDRTKYPHTNKGFSILRHLQGKGCKTGLCGQAWRFPLFDPM